MTRSIWKFPLFTKKDNITVGINADIIMPVGAEVLCVQTQYNSPYLWVVVDTEAEKEMRSFTLLGTGEDFTKHPGRYLGTFQLDGGNYVIHVFEK